MKFIRKHINESVKLPSKEQRIVTLDNIKSANESYIKNDVIPDIINSAFNMAGVYATFHHLAALGVLIACYPYEGMKPFQRDFSPNIIDIVNVGNKYEIHFGVFNIRPMYDSIKVISYINAFNSILNEICEKNSDYISDIKLVNIDCSRCEGKGYGNRMGIFSMNYNDIYETFTKAELLDIVDSCKKTTFPTSTRYMSNDERSILYLPININGHNSQNIIMYSNIHDYTSRYALGNNITLECSQDKNSYTRDTSSLTLDYMKNVMHKFIGTNIKLKTIVFREGFECMIDWPQTTDVLQYAQNEDRFYIEYTVHSMIAYMQDMKKSKYPTTSTLDTNDEFVNDILYDLFVVMKEENNKTITYCGSIYSLYSIAYHPKTNDFYLMSSYDNSVDAFTPISKIVNIVMREQETGSDLEIMDIIRELFKAHNE